MALGVVSFVQNRRSDFKADMALGQENTLTNVFLHLVYACKRELPLLWRPFQNVRKIIREQSKSLSFSSFALMLLGENHFGVNILRRSSAEQEPCHVTLLISLRFNEEKGSL